MVIETQNIAQTQRDSHDNPAPEEGNTGIKYRREKQIIGRRWET